MIRPLSCKDNVVTFSDDSKVDVFVLAREWAILRHRLDGDECMAPDCLAPATVDLHIWGHGVGRVCDEHVPGSAIRA